MIHFFRRLFASCDRTLESLEIIADTNSQIAKLLDNTNEHLRRANAGA